MKIKLSQLRELIREELNTQTNWVTYGMTSKASLQLKKELQSNGVNPNEYNFSGKHNTTISVNGANPKIKMAIRMVKEKIGLQSIILKTDDKGEYEAYIDLYKSNPRFNV